MFRLMSFGGGVQSTAIAMLAINRDPRLLRVMGDWPTAFAFSDVGSEPDGVYAHTLKIADMARAAGYRFDVVTEGNLLEDAETCLRERRKRRPWLAPFFTKSAAGRVGMMTRECTGYYKIRPLYRALTKGAGVFRKRRGAMTECVAEQWLGISTDEAQREKNSVEKWYRFRHPLLEMGWSRDDCVAYLSTQTYPDGTPMAIAKSACVFCPYAGKRRIRETLAAGGEAAEQLRRMDACLAQAPENPGAHVRSALFLTSECLRIHEIEASMRADPEPANDATWGDECAGICGV